MTRLLEVGRSQIDVHGLRRAVGPTVRGRTGRGDRMQAPSIDRRSLLAGAASALTLASVSATGATAPMFAEAVAAAPTVAAAVAQSPWADLYLALR
jgi:hypothetical protein